MAVFAYTKEDLFFPPYPSSLPLPRSPFRSQLETNVILMVTSLEISPLGWKFPRFLAGACPRETSAWGCSTSSWRGSWLQAQASVPLQFPSPKAALQTLVTAGGPEDALCLQSSPTQTHSQASLDFPATCPGIW